jgi:hypothetical protein
MVRTADVCFGKTRFHVFGAVGFREALYNTMPTWWIYEEYVVFEYNISIRLKIRILYMPSTDFQ